MSHWSVPSTGQYEGGDKALAKKAQQVDKKATDEQPHWSNGDEQFNMWLELFSCSCFSLQLFLTRQVPSVQCYLQQGWTPTLG